MAVTNPLFPSWEALESDLLFSLNPEALVATGDLVICADGAKAFFLPPLAHALFDRLLYLEQCVREASHGYVRGESVGAPPTYLHPLAAAELGVPGAFPATALLDLIGRRNVLIRPAGSMATCMEIWNAYRETGLDSLEWIRNALWKTIEQGGRTRWRWTPSCLSPPTATFSRNNTTPDIGRPGTSSFGRFVMRLQQQFFTTPGILGLVHEAYGPGNGGIVTYVDDIIKYTTNHPAAIRYHKVLDAFFQFHLGSHPRFLDTLDPIALVDDEDPMEEVVTALEELGF